MRFGQVWLFGYFLSLRQSIVFHFLIALIFLPWTLFSKEFLIICEQDGLGNGIVYEREILDKSIARSGRESSLPFPVQVAIPPSTQYALVLNTDISNVNSIITGLYKIDLTNFTSEHLLNFTQPFFIAEGGSIAINPHGTVALIGDRQPDSSHKTHPSPFLTNLIFVDLQTFMPYFSLPLTFPVKSGKYAKTGSVFGISSSAASTANGMVFVRGDPDLSQYACILGQNQLQSFDFDTEQRFAFVSSKGTNAPSIIFKIETTSMRQTAALNLIGLNSLDQICITPDNRYAIVINNDFRNTKIVKIPIDNLMNTSEDFTSYETIDLIPFVTTLTLTADGTKAVVGCRDRKTKKGKIWLIDITTTPMQVLDFYDTILPQRFLMSYIPAPPPPPVILPLQITGKSIRDLFLTSSCYETTLEWKAPENASVSFYRIYCNSLLLKQIGSNESLQFFHCLTKKAVNLIYTVQALNAQEVVVAEGNIALTTTH